MDGRTAGIMTNLSVDLAITPVLMTKSGFGLTFNLVLTTNSL